MDEFLMWKRNAQLCGSSEMPINIGFLNMRNYAFRNLLGLGVIYSYSVY